MRGWFNVLGAVAALTLAACGPAHKTPAGLLAARGVREGHLPNIAPAVAAAWMLAFTLSLDDLVIASFTSGPGATTLPIRLYSQVRLGVNPEINAVSTLLIAVVTLGVLAAGLIERRRNRS